MCGTTVLITICFSRAYQKICKTTGMPCSYSTHGKIITYTLDHPRLRKIIFHRNISSKKEGKRERKKQILEYTKVHPRVGCRLGPIDEN